MKKVIFFFCIALTQLFTQPLKTIKVNGAEAVEGQLLIKFKNSPVLGKRTVADAEAKKELMNMNRASLKKQWKDGLELWKIDGDLKTIIDEIKKNEMIEYVEPNYIYTADAITNDPGFINLWGMKNTGQNNGKLLTAKAPHNIRAAGICEHSIGE